MKGISMMSMYNTNETSRWPKEHLAIMDVDFHDVMIHNGHFKHDLYDELIDHMITDTNEKLFNRKIRNEMLMNLRKILKFFMTC